MRLRVCLWVLLTCPSLALALDPARGYLAFCQERELARHVFADTPDGDAALACLFGPARAAEGCARRLGVGAQALAYLRSHRSSFEIVGHPWSGYRLEAGRRRLQRLRSGDGGAPYAELVEQRLDLDRLERDLATRAYAQAAERAAREGRPLQWRAQAPQVDEAMLTAARSNHLRALRRQLERERSSPLRSCMRRELEELERAPGAAAAPAPSR